MFVQENLLTMPAKKRTQDEPEADKNCISKKKKQENKEDDEDLATRLMIEELENPHSDEESKDAQVADVCGAVKDTKEAAPGDAPVTSVKDENDGGGVRQDAMAEARRDAYQEGHRKAWKLLDTKAPQLSRRGLPPPRS